MLIAHPDSGLSSDTPVHRTPTEILAPVPHDRQMALWKRTGGNYGVAEAQAELEAYQAEQETVGAGSAR